VLSNTARIPGGDIYSPGCPHVPLGPGVPDPPAIMKGIRNHFRDIVEENRTPSEANQSLWAASRVLARGRCARPLFLRTTGPHSLEPDFLAASTSARIAQRFTFRVSVSSSCKTSLQTTIASVPMMRASALVNVLSVAGLNCSRAGASAASIKDVRRSWRAGVSVKRWSGMREHAPCRRAQRSQRVDYLIAAMRHCDESAKRSCELDCPKRAVDGHRGYRGPRSATLFASRPVSSISRRQRRATRSDTVR
jgi:hypothetical protein